MTVNSTIATLLGTVFAAAIILGCGHSPQPDPTVRSRTNTQHRSTLSLCSPSPVRRRLR